MNLCHLTGLECEEQTTDSFSIHWIRVTDVIHYAMDSKLYRSLEYDHDLINNYALKGNLIHEAIKANNNGKRILFTYDEYSDEDKNYIFSSCSNMYSVSSISSYKSILDLQEKKKLLLQTASRMARYLQNPFSPITFSTKDMLYCRILTRDEFLNWLNVLQSEALLLRVGEKSFCLTPKSFTEEIESQKLTKTAFIAMSFDKEMGATRSSIIKTIEESGFEPKIVDDEHFLGGVMDKINVLIREADFVVADFTGHKSGVYYEAGIAEGLGKPVIYIGEAESMKENHFDIAHITQIRYDDNEHLESTLKDRIEYLKKTVLNTK